MESILDDEERDGASGEPVDEDHSVDPEADPQSDTESDPEPDQDLVMVATRAAADKKALDIVLLNISEVATFTDYFLICSGTSTRHVQTLADAVEDSLRKLGRRPSHIEGYSAAEWILLDYGDFIVHAFSASARRFYDLERLWRDGVRVALPDELTGGGS